MPVKFSFSKREQAIFLILIVLLTVFGVYRFGYVPVTERIRVLDQKRRTAVSRLVKNRQIIARARRSEEEFQVVLEKYRQGLTDEEFMAGMLSVIEKEAQGIGVLVADVKPRKGKKLEGYNRFSVSLAVEGDMVDVLNFVYRLQAPPNGLDIDDIQIRRKSSRAQDLRGQMTLSTMTLPGT